MEFISKNWGWILLAFVVLVLISIHLSDKRDDRILKALKDNEGLSATQIMSSAQVGLWSIHGCLAYLLAEGLISESIDFGPKSLGQLDPALVEMPMYTLTEKGRNYVSTLEYGDECY